MRSSRKTPSTQKINNMFNSNRPGLKLMSKSRDKDVKNGMKRGI